MATQRCDAGDWRPAFLTVLAQTANVRLSARKAGISKKTAYKHRATDPEFAEQWEDAVDQALGTLEGEAYRRALTTSDHLLWKLLQVHDPDRFRESTRNVNLNLTPDDLKKLGRDELEQLLAALNR